MTRKEGGVTAGAAAVAGAIAGAAVTAAVKSRRSLSADDQDTPEEKQEG
jgi:hypothetical protein